ncbi:MAG TPA: flagellar basal-body MS-ring/collar protein FliF [candidate division Zixibacteria bacterium]|nr:flagellar basal-body MS-ring/collar protein FliF [candidate division Zixibacteria bacterium]
MAQAITLSQQAAQLKDFVAGLSGRQKLALAGGAAVVATTLFLFVQFSQDPETKLLYSGMRPDEAQALVAQLNAKNIGAKLSADGTGVQVPADKLDAARLDIASHPTPRSGRMGFELFDKNSWAASDFDEHVTYQRALEGELERTIAGMNGVEAVRVHLTMASESLFADKEQNAKAAVIIKLNSGLITPTMQASIARLVSSSVDKLAPESVTVVDANTNRALQLQQQPGAEIDALSMNDVLAQRVEKTLEPIVGLDHVRASVEVQFENANTEESQEVYEPNSAVAISVQRTEETTGAAQMGGTVGTASNLPNKNGAVPATRTESTQSSSRSENSTFVVNKLTRHTVHPAGGIRRISAAILVDDAVVTAQKNGAQVAETRKRSPEQMKQVEELAKASIGFDAARGDTITVQNISFLSLPPEQPLPPTRAERARKIVNDYSSAVRILVLIVLFGIAYLLVLRPVKKQIIAAFDRTKELSSRSARSVPAAEQEDELLVAPEPEPEMKRTAQLRKQLAQKVREQPAAAAQLVQSWLREDQR